MMLQNLEAVLARQRQIEQNKVVGILLDLDQSLFAIDRRFDGVAFQRQQRFQRFADSCFVVDDQDRCPVSNGRAEE